MEEHPAIGETRRHVFLASRPHTGVAIGEKAPSRVATGIDGIARIRLTSRLLHVGIHDRAAELQKPLVRHLPVYPRIYHESTVCRPISFPRGRLVPAISRRRRTAPDRHSYVARRVRRDEYRLYAEGHVVAGLCEKRRGDRVLLARASPLLRTGGDVGWRIDVEGSGKAQRELVFHDDLVCVDHAPLPPGIAPDGGIFLEVHLAAAQMRPLEIHVDRAARAVVVLLGPRPA